jgi:hypothetical protein
MSIRQLDIAGRKENFPDPPRAKQGTQHRDSVWQILTCVSSIKWLATQRRGSSNCDLTTRDGLGSASRTIQLFERDSWVREPSRLSRRIAACTEKVVYIQWDCALESGGMIWLERRSYPICIRVLSAGLSGRSQYATLKRNYKPILREMLVFSERRLIFSLSPVNRTYHQYSSQDLCLFLLWALSIYARYLMTMIKEINPLNLIAPVFSNSGPFAITLKDT